MTACYLFKFTVAIDDQTQRFTGGTLVEEREFASRDYAEAEGQDWMDADDSNVSWIQPKRGDAVMNEHHLAKTRHEIAQNPAAFFGA